ncbi:MAG: DUF502 domain-containing protein [Clostridia bacterium]|nr:DUF502 domain-containing protein [Clostridia bacterium]
MRKISNWLLSGIAVILPIGVTIYALVWGFNLLDSVLSKWTNQIFGYRIPGLGIVIMLLFIMVVGLLTSNVIGKRILQGLQKRISKIPVIKMIYNPVNKIVSDFSSKNSDSFQKVVLVDFPMYDSKSIGFVTNSHLSINGVPKVSVFVPTVPNPTNGHMIIIDVDKVEILDITIAEGVNMVITMGSVLDKAIHTETYTIRQMEDPSVNLK